jgi:hypothetical protein
MPKPGSCTICQHADRAAIETALQAGEALRTIADRFGASKTVLIRHKQHSASQDARKALLAEAQTLREATLRARDLAGLMQVTRRLAQLVVQLCSQDE